MCNCKYKNKCPFYEPEIEIIGEIPCIPCLPIEGTGTIIDGSKYKYLIY